MQPYFRTEGIVLNAFPFQDYDLILSVFSLNEGLIKLIVKKALCSKNRTTISPLTQIECVYSKGKSELYKCKEISLLNPFLRIRDNLNTLESASEMIRVVLNTQQIHSPAPHLYALLRGYLEKIPFADDSKVFSTSFYLKTLRHEGLLELEPRCSVCSSHLNTYSLANGQNYCSSHRPPHHLSFNEDEMALLLDLAFCQNFSKITNISISFEFYEKIKSFFKERTND